MGGIATVRANCSKALVSLLESAGRGSSLREESPRASGESLPPDFACRLRRRPVALLSGRDEPRSALGSARRSHPGLATRAVHRDRGQDQAFDGCLVGPSCPLRASCFLSLGTDLEGRVLRGGLLFRAYGLLARAAPHGSGPQPLESWGARRPHLARLIAGRFLGEGVLRSTPSLPFLLGARV